MDKTKIKHYLIEVPTNFIKKININKWDMKIHQYIIKTTYYLDIIGEKLAKKGISANFVSVVGFIIGLSAINFISLQMYWYALAAVLINRLFDGIDGAIARAGGMTNFGLFLDATLDYIFYAGVIFAFALARPEQNAVTAAFLLFAFTSSAAAMLAYSIIAYKNDTKDNMELSSSPFYLGGVAQGFEAFVAIVLFCIFPKFFTPIAAFAGVLSFIKTLSTVATAYYTFVILAKKNNK